MVRQTDMAAARLSLVRGPRRVLGYARVSSEEQARGSSLDDQQNVIRAHASKIGVSVASFYVEAESAVHEKFERREQIQALMRDVRAGDVVVCDKLDRWSRDPEFTYRSIREIREAGASFFAVGDQCDPSTADGDTMLHVRVLVAREEHKRIRQRTVGTRKLLRDRGYYVEGLPPYGYRRSLPKGVRGSEKNVLVIDENRAATVRAIFRHCIAGKSINKIASTLGITRDVITSVLAARIYIGEILDSRGQWIAGKHAPIVDVDTFAAARAALAERRKGGARPRGGHVETRDWILRDVATCGLCGARMSAAYAGPHERRNYYYRCAHHCTTRYINVRVVEAEAATLVLARLEELRDELAREPDVRTPSRPVIDVSERRAKLIKRRERFLEAFADAMMSRDELRAALAKLDGQGLELDAIEAAQRRPSPLANEKTRRSVLRNVDQIRRAWTAAPPSTQRAIVSRLIRAARMAAGVDLHVDWRTVEELAASV
jgi:DNA invertase Pin-like site-specific DNA recombinase